MTTVVETGGLRVELSLSRKEERFSELLLLEQSTLGSLLEKALGKDYRLLRVCPSFLPHPLART
jgi:hypothetical protein